MSAGYMPAQGGRPALRVLGSPAGPPGTHRSCPTPFLSGQLATGTGLGCLPSPPAPRGMEGGGALTSRSEPSSVTQPCAVQSRSPQAWGRATVGSSPIVRTCSQHLPPQALHTHREIPPPKVGASSEDPPFTNWDLFPSPCREHPHLTNTCLVSVNPDTCSA